MHILKILIRFGQKCGDNMEKILVTGGAGYVGHHVCKMLSDNDYMPIIIDRVASSKQYIVDNFGYVDLDINAYGDWNYLKLLETVKDNNIKSVIHLAGSIEVGESVIDPSKYYDNNIRRFLNFLDYVREIGVENIIVASSAAVYGIPKVKYLKPSTTPCIPVNPYGRTKLWMEQILQDYNKAYGFNSVALRIFNVCGADPSGDFGEEHDPETHLIPRILNSVKTNDPFTIYGINYDTPDGTCIRDYVHVNDVANAFLRSLKFLEQCQKDGVNDCRQFNVGSGKGTSILSIISEINKQLNCKVNVKYGSIREGDPPSLIANIDDTKEYLEWQPVYSKLSNIIQTANNWHKI